MENKKTDDSVKSGLKLEGEHAVHANPVFIPEERPNEDPDEIIHQQENELTAEQIKQADPDELVHDVDTFNEDVSNDDPDDLVHRQLNRDDSEDR